MRHHPAATTKTGIYDDGLSAVTCMLTTKDQIKGTTTMATDISWALKAVKMIYYHQEYDAAIEEFGLARVRFLNQVVQLAVENRKYPFPNEPGWIDFFTFILEGIEQEFGPLDGTNRTPAPAAQAVTMTEYYGHEDWRTGYPR